jgi:hypothetical protein
LSPLGKDLLLASTDNNIKLKDATDEELEILDNMLLIITGQQFKTTDEVILNYTKYMPLLVEVHGNYAIEEIKLAYKLAKKGSLTNEKNEQFKLYRELNFASACDVMLAYDEYKKRQLGNFIQNQNLFLSSESKPKNPFNEINAISEFLKESWEITDENEIDKLRGSFLYDYFKEVGLIDLSFEEKKEIQELAYAMFKSEKELEKTITADYNLFKQIENSLKKITPDDSEIVILSKKIAFGYQIRNWQIEGLDIQDIIDKLKQHSHSG